LVFVALIALVGSASATDVSAHARLSELGEGLFSAITRIKPADDFSNAMVVLSTLVASLAIFA